MFVEIHLLQNFAPSNLNRDDTNSPKDCTFGGARRARISSQCFKRAIRQDAGFIDGVKGRVAQRTKLVHQPLIEALVTKGRGALEAAGRVKKAFEAVGFKWDDDKGRTSVLLFVAPDEIARWAEVIDAHWEALGAVVAPAPELVEGDKNAKKKTAKQEKQAKKDTVPPATIKALGDAMKATTVHAVDVALFGRMVAENTDMNVDAACQVAHAISTHAVQMEMDFFTAVDDLQPSAETGAGMMGVVEFNSACFYRYALVDVKQLAKSLGGDKALVRDAVVSFCEAAVKAIPSGKQNSFAARNPPDWVHIEVRDSGTPRSLVNAFAEPVRVTKAEGDLVGQSITKAQNYAGQLSAMLDDGAPRFVGTASTRSGADVVSLPALLRGLGSALTEGLA